MNYSYVSFFRSGTIEILDIESNPNLDEEEGIKNDTIENNDKKSKTASTLETHKATNDIQDASKIAGDLVVTDVEAGLSIRDEPDGEGISLISSDEPKIMSRSSLVGSVIFYQIVA